MHTLRRLGTIAAVGFGLLLAIGQAQAQQLPYGQWTEFPGTTLSDNVAGCLHAWAGAMYDDVDHEFIHPDVGGHGCASMTNDGDSYAVDLDTALFGGEGWRQVEPPIPATSAMWPGYTGNGCFLQQSDGTLHPPEVHTYGGPTWLGNGKGLLLGAFMICVGTPDQVAALVDTTTTPWTWTHLPHLLPYSHTTASVLSGQYVYIVHRDGGWAKVDKDSLAIVANGNIGPVKHLNVNMPSSSSFTSGASMGAGGINEDGFFCTRISTAITCFNTNGQAVDSANNDSFGRGIRRSVPAECQVSGSSMTPIPGGEFAMWGGGKTLCLFKPDPEPFLAASDGHVCSTTELQANCGYDGDTWRVIDPPTGPAVNKVYNKLAWYEPGQILVGYGPSNLWGINPFEGGPTNNPPVANDVGPLAFAEDTQSNGTLVATDETAVTFSVLTDAQNGAFDIDANTGAFTYVPLPNYSGPDQATVRVSDGELHVDAVISFSVVAVNDAPLAVDDAFSGDEETEIAGCVLTNDTDIDSTMTAALVEAPADGTFALVEATGCFTYTPAGNVSGTRTFHYAATDGTDSDEGLVTITINDVAEPNNKIICGGEVEYPAGPVPNTFTIPLECNVEEAALPPPPPPPPPEAGSYSTSSFEARAAGAIFSNAFDVQPPSGGSGVDAVTVNQGNTNWVRPHRVTSPDGEGALQFDLLPFSSSGASGAYVFRFPENTCDLGDTCHLQWRLLANDAFVNTIFERHDTTGKTSPKIIIFSRKESSCERNEIVITTTTSIAPRRLAMYNHCGDFAQIPRENWSPPVDTWVTYNLSVTKPTSGYLIGEKTYFDTAIRLQVKPDGGEVFTVVDRIQPMRAMDYPHDAAYITHFTNKKDPAQDHPHAFTLLDEVIYRKGQPIPFP